MSIIEKHIAFVNYEIAFQEKMLEKVGGNKNRQLFHTDLRDKLKGLLADIVVADRLLDECEEERRIAEGSRKSNISLTPEDIEGLPEELIQELSISEADKVEFALAGLIEEAGGVLSMDRILIGIYKKTGEIFKRTAMTSKLYRMSQKGLVFGVPNKKGWYSTRELAEEDVERIFGSK